MGLCYTSLYFWHASTLTYLMLNSIIAPKPVCFLDFFLCFHHSSTCSDFKLSNFSYCRIIDFQGKRTSKTIVTSLLAYNLSNLSSRALSALSFLLQVGLFISLLKNLWKTLSLFATESPHFLRWCREPFMLWLQTQGCKCLAMQIIQCPTPEGFFRVDHDVNGAFRVSLIA